MLADVDGAREEVGAHVCDEVGAVGRGGELDAVHGLVVAVVGEGGVCGGGGGSVGVGRSDLAKLAVIVLAGVCDDVDVFGASEAGGFLRGLERPGAGDQVVQLHLLDLLAQLLLVVADLLCLCRHPDGDHVVDDSTEFAAATALQEQDLVAIGAVRLGDVQQLSQAGLCVCEDGVCFGRAVGDFCDADSRVVVVEQCLGRFFQHAGRQRRGACTEVVDVFSCGHCDGVRVCVNFSKKTRFLSSNAWYFLCLQQLDNCGIHFFVR